MSDGQAVSRILKTSSGVLECIAAIGVYFKRNLFSTCTCKAPYNLLVDKTRIF